LHCPASSVAALPDSGDKVMNAETSRRLYSFCCIALVSESARPNARGKLRRKERSD
jgi:hypothetical protein